MNDKAISIRIGGLARLSTVDWPGELVATLFCQGCPWRCPYCHNPHLLGLSGLESYSWPDIMAFLESRITLLDGVVFSGGEPLIQPDLHAAMVAVKDMGFRIGLHTAGPNPQRLREVLPLVDWVGFDMKAPFDDYERITKIPNSARCARESLETLIDSGVDCQVRTTVHPKLLDQAALERLRADLNEMGVPDTHIQTFRPQGCQDENLLSA